MADYGRKLKTTNGHLQSLTSARFVHIDGSTTPVTVVATTNGCNLQSVILNTNGAVVTVRSGSQDIAIIASDAPEGVFPYGVYCDQGIQVDTSGAVDVTIVYDR